MKLYFSPGACSLSPRIVAAEAGIPLEFEKVDLASKKTAGGRDFTTINPKGYVPALELDDGTVLSEGPAIVQYLGDLKPDSTIVPKNLTLARYRLQEWLAYINSEIHKSYGPLFRPNVTPELRKEKEEELRKRYAVVDKALAKGPFLLGEQFTAADAYLFTVTNWAGFLKIDLQSPNVQAFSQRVAARPAVLAALKAEGLV